MDGDILILILISILILIGLITGGITLSNYTNKIDCRNMSNNGYDTKIVKQIIFSKECWVKLEDTNKFMEYSKWRSFND